MSGTMDNSIVIEFVDTVFGYDPGKIILDNINLTIAGNDFIAILGQNGCGKTTLLKNISGLLRPQQGSVFLKGTNTANMSIAEIAGHIGFVMQESERQLFESSVYDEVAFALKRRLAHNAIRPKVEEALAKLGLLDKRDAFPLALNRADRVKTLLAAVLAMDPKILMLDEPLAGQDVQDCRMIMDVIADLHREGCTVIMVTHNISVAAEFARRIMVMHDGMVCMDGSPSEIFGQEEKLSDAGIYRPPITRLSASLSKTIPLEKNALSPAELAAMLVSLK